MTKEQAIERLNKGKANPWYELAKPKKLTEYNFDDSVNSLLSIANKKAREKAKLETSGDTEAADLIVLDTDLSRAIKAVQSNAQLRQYVLEQAYGKKSEQKADEQSGEQSNEKAA